MCAIAQPASAQPALRLSYEAPAACPVADWVSERIARYLGREVDLRDDAPLIAQVSIELASSREFVAELALESADGRRARELRDRDCVLVGDAVAFVVALAIDPSVRADDAPLTASERERAAQGAAATPDASSAPGGGAPTPAASANAGAAVADRVQPRERVTPPAPAREDTAPEPDTAVRSDSRAGPPLAIAGALGVTAGVASLPLPELSPGAALYFALRPGHVVRLELGVGYSLPQAKSPPNDPHVAAQFDELAASFASCVVPALAGSELGGCLRVHAGIARGRASEFSAGRNTAAPYVSLSLGPVWLQPIGERFALRLELAPSVTLVRPRFTIGEPGSEQVVHEPERIGFLAAAGGELRFD